MELDDFTGPDWTELRRSSTDTERWRRILVGRLSHVTFSVVDPFGKHKREASALDPSYGPPVTPPASSRSPRSRLESRLQATWPPMNPIKAPYSPCPPRVLPAVSASARRAARSDVAGVDAPAQPELEPGADAALIAEVIRSACAGVLQTASSSDTQPKSAAAEPTPSHQPRLPAPLPPIHAATGHSNRFVSGEATSEARVSQLLSLLAPSSSGTSSQLPRGQIEGILSELALLAVVPSTCIIISESYARPDSRTQPSTRTYRSTCAPSAPSALVDQPRPVCSACGADRLRRRSLSCWRRARTLQRCAGRWRCWRMRRRRMRPQLGGRWAGSASHVWHTLSLTTSFSHPPHTFSHPPHTLLTPSHTLSHPPHTLTHPLTPSHTLTHPHTPSHTLLTFPSIATGGHRRNRTPRQHPHHPLLPHNRHPPLHPPPRRP